jgi:hypothetical protein
MPRSRTGCLGNLLRLVAVFALCGAAVLVAVAVFAPWAYYLGGTFHLPYWQGWGTMKSKTGGEYVVYMTMYPGSPTRLGSAYMSGDGYICTPRHERFRLKMNALMRRGLGRNTEGEAISIHMYNWGVSRMVNPVRRPSVDFRGRWTGNTIVGTDGGSIDQAFLADGSLNRGRLLAARDPLPITINAGTISGFDTECGGMK